METKHITKKSHHLFMIIAGIGLLFCSIFILQAANEGKLYDALSTDTPPTSPLLAQKVQNMQNTFAANKAIQDNEYETALSFISGTSSQDYYNRGTIQTLLAYKNALQSSISGLQTAQNFIAQAQHSFQIAQKLGPSTALYEAIQENQNTLQALSPVVDIKTCYGVGQTIISFLQNIHTTIQNIKTTLEQEDDYLTRKSSLISDECYEKLRYIVDSSNEQVSMLQLDIEYKKKTYLTDFSNKIDNPEICIDTPYENILPSLIKGKKGLEEYEQLHKNTIDALQSNDKKSIQELCEQTKNDAQINQDIENSLQELLQKLEENTIEEQEKKRTSQEVKYKDFFTEDEKKVLKDIQDINQGRINTILDIRGKGNYEPQRYINDMFNQFYGNSGDFIDLHK